MGSPESQRSFIHSKPTCLAVSPAAPQKEVPCRGGGWGGLKRGLREAPKRTSRILTAPYSLSCRPRSTRRHAFPHLGWGPQGTSGSALARLGTTLGHSHFFSNKFKVSLLTCSLRESTGVKACRAQGSQQPRGGLRERAPKIPK